MNTPAPLPALSQRGRIVALAGFALVLTAVNLRTAVTGFTPLLEIIGSHLGFGVTLAGFLGAIPAASFAVFGFLAPTVTRRFGLERTVTISLALTAVALILRALAPTPLVLVLSTVLALAGIGAANVVIVPLIKAWFPQRIALWTSLYLIFLQVGQFLAPLIAVPVAEATSWGVSVGIWAIPAAVAAIAWFFVAARRKARTAPVAAQTTAEAQGAAPALGRSSTVWGLVVLFAMLSVSNYGIVTWMPAVLTDAGGSAAVGGTMVALYSSWGVAAAFVVPHLATRMKNPFLIVAVCAVLLVIGYLGLLFSPLVGTLIWVCSLGIGVSTFPLCMTLINRQTDTPQSASAVSGFVQGIGYALACFGPIGLGLLHEATGSWTVPLLVLAATTIPGLIGGWFACRPRRVRVGESASAPR